MRYGMFSGLCGQCSGRTHSWVQIDGMVEEVCMDHLHATAFQYTPLGRPILGSAQNIQKMTKEDVEAYIRTHYTAGGMRLPCLIACSTQLAPTGLSTMSKCSLRLSQLCF